MVFGELNYQGDYADMHAPLVALIKPHFAHVQSGLQGDSWIWVVDGDDKVAIDTFSAMTHQIKCENAHSILLKEVITVLSLRYSLVIYEQPQIEPHEEK